jgi:hypothetical protein
MTPGKGGFVTDHVWAGLPPKNGGLEITCPLLDFREDIDIMEIYSY